MDNIFCNTKRIILQRVSSFNNCYVYHWNNTIVTWIYVNILLQDKLLISMARHSPILQSIPPSMDLLMDQFPHFKA